MNIAKLISILQTLPMDSVIQIGFYDQDYERARTIAVSEIKFQEAWKIKGDQEPRQTNRVTLS